jgi:hypothetical protein
MVNFCANRYYVVGIKQHDSLQQDVSELTLQARRVVVANSVQESTTLIQ